MKILQRSAWVVVVFIPMLAWASEAQEHWPKVSTGEYKGYAELYAVSEGNYTIEGDTNLGGECELQVSTKGVDYDGEFFPWDAPGLQAARDTKEGRQRINFRGRIGDVVVADLTWEKPKGKIVNVLRMSVAPYSAKNVAHEIEHATEEKPKP